MWICDNFPCLIRFVPKSTWTNETVPLQLEPRARIPHTGHQMSKVEKAHIASPSKMGFALIQYAR